jgi:hypothetical protein
MRSIPKPQPAKKPRTVGFATPSATVADKKLTTEMPEKAPVDERDEVSRLIFSVFFYDLRKSEKNKIFSGH